jgi:hypothetical protein
MKIELNLFSAAGLLIFVNIILLQGLVPQALPRTV